MLSDARERDEARWLRSESSLVGFVMDVGHSIRVVAEIDVVC